MERIKESWMKVIEIWKESEKSVNNPLKPSHNSPTNLKVHSLLPRNTRSLKLNENSIKGICRESGIRIREEKIMTTENQMLLQKITPFWFLSLCCFLFLLFYLILGIWGERWEWNANMFEINFHLLQIFFILKLEYF